MTYLISLETTLTDITFHIVSLNALNRTYTFKAGSINATKDLQNIREWILCNNYKDMVNYFKGKVNLTKATVTFSYGPNIRQLIKLKKTTGGK